MPLTTQAEWDLLTDQQKLQRLNDVEIDRENLRSYVHILAHTPEPAMRVPVIVREHATISAARN